MSHNLRLVDSRSGASCKLFHTPPGATDLVLRFRGNADRVATYFDWIRDECEPGAGAFLDHKVEVLTFLVTYPNAEFTNAEFTST